MSFFPKPIKLQDCSLHGPRSQAELFIVEGDSASTALAALCDKEFQAVLPMQGKPLNANKHARKTVLAYPLFQEVILALGYPEILDRQTEGYSLSPSKCRYSQIILVFDPDADGIHCGALMQIFFYKILRPILDAGMLRLIRAPLYRFHVASKPPRTIYAYLEEQARKLAKELQQENFQFERQRYRGLASIERDTLASICTSSSTRTLEQIRAADAEAALAVFGGL